MWVFNSNEDSLGCGQGSILRLNENHFSQLVKDPTHIEGNLIDHAYKRDIHGNLKYSVELHSKYYTDHKAMAVMIHHHQLNSLA